jgi:serine/threonine-protein kinase
MSDYQVGTRKGDYEILSVLGVGGMGKVYKVRNVLSDRVEAMKVLLPNLADQKDLANRFLREIKVLAGLNHPNIAAMRTALTMDNQLIMIMEFLEGTTLDARLEHGAIPCGEAVNYIGQVLAALGYAHQQQIVHRDVKPSNMMLTPEGVIKLMDFGIARSGRELNLTVTGTTLGSIAYMSPEQVTCQPLDGRSDLYSVGVSLYEIVTGQKPFNADSNFSIMKAHLQDLPKRPIELNPSIPESMSKIILMALEKDPKNRFQSADAFRNALMSVAAEQGAPVAPTQTFVPARSISEVATVHLTPTPVPALKPTGASTAPMPTPTVAPVVPAGPMQPPQAGAGGKRGLYIAFGALAVVAILVVAGISMPRFFGTRANDQAASQSKTSSHVPAKSGANASQPADADTTSTATPAADANPPAAQPAKSESTDQPASAAGKEPAPAPSKGAGKQQQERAAAGKPAEPDSAEIAALDDEVDQLSSRAIAVGTSLENLQKQQAAQGLGLRGDIVEAQQLMHAFLAKAKAAVQAKDVKSARKYLDMAERQTEKIEKFLGR